VSSAGEATASEVALESLEVSSVIGPAGQDYLQRHDRWTVTLSHPAVNYLTKIPVSCRVLSHCFRGGIEFDVSSILVLVSAASLLSPFGLSSLNSVPSISRES